ncbi:hypothetical protein Tco_1320363 [Tanacetum coccineum]
MPRKSSEDHKNTRAYIPMISHEYRTPIKEKLRDLEIRYIHEGRVVFDNFADLNYVRSLFHFVEFECLLEISEQICPRFILEFYSQYRVSYFDEGQMFIEFVIQNQFFSYSLEEFALILDVPCEGACVFTDRWRLDELAYGIPSDGPYQTNLPSIEDIISSIRIDRDSQVCRIRHEEEIDVIEYQVLTHEIEPTLKPLEEVIRENVFCMGVIRIMENPELDNESYVLYDRVMNPLAAQLERKARRDRGTRRGRHSTSSSFAFDQPSSSHLNDDDDDGNDEGTSRAITPSPIRYVNSLTNQVPQGSIRRSYSHKRTILQKAGRKGPNRWRSCLRHHVRALLPEPEKGSQRKEERQNGTKEKNHEGITSHNNHHHHHTITNAQLKALIDQGVADALVARDADRSMNGDDIHNLGTGVRRQAPLARECTYLDFLKYKPLYFKGTKGVVELTQWFERMEAVFRISNCIVETKSSLPLVLFLEVL